VSKKTVWTRRGIRRMLVTTLGRIERIEEVLGPDTWRTDPPMTPTERTECMGRLEKERVALREYNKIAATLI